MQQLGNFGNFSVRFRVVQRAVDQLPLGKFGIVPKAVRDSTYFLSPKLPLALRKSSSIKGHANA